MSNALKGRKILVTRPADQAEPLCAMIEAAGGRAIRLPTIRIEPAALRGDLKTRLSHLHLYRIGIFISRNAVHHTLQLLYPGIARLNALMIIAIGRATASALRGAGLCAVTSEDAKSTSETLLQLPQLQAARVQGCNILVFRGAGGRELLAETLRKRGARVDYASVYRRVAAKYDPALLHEIWLRNKPDLIVASSTEGLQNLLDMSTPAHRQIILETALAVLSRRMAAQAQTLGFKKTPVVAEQTSDQGLFEAIWAALGD